MEITHVQIRKILGHQKVKAVVSVTLGGDFAINDIRVIQGDDRLFVAMPSKYNALEQGFHDIVHPITAQARKELEDAVLSAYSAALSARAAHSAK